MRWISTREMMRKVPPPSGYRMELLKRSDISKLIRFIASWFPDISVGAASCYLRRDFYAEKVYLAGEPERDVLVVLILQGQELAGMFSCERERDARTLYAGLAVVAAEHRGAHLGQTCIAMAEVIGRKMKMGLIYGMATMKVPYVQRAFELLGWQLIGITPGYDREMVAPGVVKRVFEAVYAKVLGGDVGLLPPNPRNLTQKTKAFLRILFPGFGAFKRASARRARIV